MCASTCPSIAAQNRYPTPSLDRDHSSTGEDEYHMGREKGHLEDVSNEQISIILERKSQK